MPRVSVIIPVYNGDRFISQAVDSVMAQTCQDWELIVVDDGSTDSTPEILATFQDPRITKIHQHNQGVSAARNTGLDESHGEYIVFLDADDVYLESTLADLSGYLNSHSETDAVYSDGIICDEHGEHLMRLSQHRLGIYSGYILERVVLSSSIVMVPACTMIRRKVVDMHGLRFDPVLSFSADWDFWIHLARYATFGYLDKLTCLYRVHQTNMTVTCGVMRRNDDLVEGRLKILNSEWFMDLSESTRYQFCYDLILGVLAGRIDRQREIIRSSQFCALPTENRARVLTHVATDYLLHMSEIEFAKDCLIQAVIAQPDVRKSRILLRLLEASPTLCSTAVQIWHFGHRVTTWARQAGHRHPRPMPASLTP